MDTSRRRRGVDAEETTMDELSVHSHKKNRPLGQKAVSFLVAVLFLGCTTAFWRSALLAPGDLVRSSSSAYQEIERPDYSVEFQNCTISFQPSPPKAQGTWTTKPLWISGYPSSGAEASGEADRAKPLVSLITGLKGGAKNYHASSKQLKRCRGVDETATCSQVHPVVGIGPESRTGDFSPNVIMSIRNFKTALPAFYSKKANLYHGVVGQMPEDSWRQLRDQYVEYGFADWKGLLKAWKSMEYYRISMYLPYEHLLDRTKGPITVQRLADKLNEAGFDVAPPSDMPCIWYKATQSPLAYEKDYYTYTPGFTAKQRDFMLQEMKKMMEDMADDVDLVAILQEYYDDIRDHTRIDQPWTPPANTTG
jgi:hypothetical protein